jgi:molybdopterin converting factor small subunit
VNGEDCRSVAGQDTPVTHGAEVQIIPSVAGGSEVVVPPFLRGLT